MKSNSLLSGLFVLVSMAFQGCQTLGSTENDADLSLQLNLSTESVNMDAEYPRLYASVAAKSKTGGMKFSYRVRISDGTDVSSKFLVPVVPEVGESQLSYENEHWVVDIPRNMADLGSYEFEVTLTDKSGKNRTKASGFEVSNSARNRDQAIYSAGVVGFSDGLHTGTSVHWSGKLYFTGNHLSLRPRVRLLPDSTDRSDAFTIQCPTVLTSSPFDLSQITVTPKSGYSTTAGYLFELRGEDENSNYLVRRDALSSGSSSGYEY